MELWKNIKGYEGIYQISNHGKVRSLTCVLTDKNGRRVMHKGKEMKQTPNSSGYLRVFLKKNGVGRYWFVHRLVALHFVSNNDTERNNVVNHLDSNFLNNSASNLEWTTPLGNVQHAIKNGRTRRTREWLRHLRESNEVNGKSVIGINLNTGETIRFVCLNDSRKAGFEPSCVCDCCKGKRRTHKGYKWRYA